MYNTFQRLAWNGALAWVIFSCVKGYGGMINEFLSWSAFAPLSRLTFCSYLIHMNVITMFGSSVLATFPNDFEIWSNVWYYLAIQFVSCVIAFGFVLVFELPATRSEKIIVELVLSWLVPKEVSKKTADNGAVEQAAGIPKLQEKSDEIGPNDNMGQSNEGYEDDSAKGEKWIEANTAHTVQDQPSSADNNETSSESNETKSETDKSSDSSTPSAPPSYEQLMKDADQIQRA
eukprot:TRINITY_DN9986_c0_g1_i1.p1 TRINITY_DN9986_c0_g1~~TRINITY_DN9986_c0_g1_i1.p1  ORF type:complete len:242 (+),score=44.12 TRINITY_DN9986_c0_g1_i1:32-727(+)